MKSYRILIFNNSGKALSFFIYQQPALYSVSLSSMRPVQSSSLGTKALSSGLGASIEFTIDIQVYAGVQEPDMLSTTPGRLSVPSALLGDMAGVAVMPSFAVQAIQVSAPGTRDANATTVSINPLGLSTPTYIDTVRVGCFRIAIPSYTPSPSSSYNAGCAVIDSHGGVIFSSFVKAPPAQFLDCAPVAIFYVAVGNQSAGTIVNVADTGVTAKCDFTTGVRTITATYNANGSWSVN